MIGTTHLGHFLGNVAFVIARIVKGDCEGLHGALLDRRCHADDRTAVDTSRQVTRDWNVCFEAECDGFHQLLADQFYVFVVGTVGMLAFEWEFCVPILTLVDDKSVRAALDDHHRSRLKCFYILIKRHAGHHDLHHLVQLCLWTHVSWNIWVSEQGLHFRRPENGFFRQMIEKWPNPKAVSNDDRLLGFFVMDDEGELTTQMFDEIQAVLAVKFECDLAVGLGTECVPICPE